MGKEKDGRQRLPPTSTTTRELYLYSGNQCAYPGCVNSLLKDDSTWNCQAAHIYGVKSGAARGDHDLSDEDLRDVSNLLLMCLEHHKVIDNKASAEQYTVEVVQKMKENHEGRYRQAIAGLVRIVDTTDGSRVDYPTNLGNWDGFADNDQEMAQYIEDMKPWIAAIAAQPPGIRDLIVLILAHGKPGNGSRDERVRVKVTQIEGVAQIGEHEIRRRAVHLEDEGLLSIDAEQGILELIDPTSRSIGWDLFSELHGLGSVDRAVYRRAIDDLDFTVFDL